MSGGYGPTGNEPQWDDSVWQQDQPTGWTGQENARPGQRQYGGQSRGGQNYDGRGYGGQDYDPSQGQAQGRPGPGYGGQAYGDPGYDGRGYGQPDPRTGPGSGYRPQGPGAGAQQYPRGTGGQPVQRGTGGMQVPPGYDPRGADPRRSGSYAQRDAGYGQGGYDSGQRDDSFLPGFGPRDDFDGDRQYDDTRRGRRARAADPRQADPRQADPRQADPRQADPRQADPRRSAEFAGQAPPRSRGDGRRPRDDDRDPRAPGRRGGGGTGGGNGRDGLDREAWSQYRGEKRRRSPIRRLAPWIALLVIVVPLALGGWHIWGIYQAKVHPADYTGAGIAPKVTVQVTNGETASELAPTLVTQGVVESTRAFVVAAENSSNPTGLEPGFFVLNSHMQATLAWAALLNPKNRDQAVVTIPEGKRASQVILIMAKDTKIPLKDFQAVLAHPAQLDLPAYAKGKVEGYLFPATYTIQPHETALQILQAMVTRFKQEAQQIDLPAAAQRVGLTPTEVIIDASMAQAEGGSVSDYPKIAEVINNRLKIDMALQFDSVLLYGLGKYQINVTDAQIATKGPYNDFEHTGRPPGPISNPGDAAIQGVLHPATGDYLYFLTETGGKSDFSHTPLKGQ
ncbi:MAG TPA: endolytic transglycosylase MltG [Trebonia sp.]|nr:endolytic transglycosylase MltG [Trebonia sp.]